jgi:hypothetical protein
MLNSVLFHLLFYLCCIDTCKEDEENDDKTEEADSNDEDDSNESSVMYRNLHICLIVWSVFHCHIIARRMRTAMISATVKLMKKQTSMMKTTAMKAR